MTLIAIVRCKRNSVNDKRRGRFRSVKWQAGALSLGLRFLQGNPPQSGAVQFSISVKYIGVPSALSKPSLW